MHIKPTDKDAELDLTFYYEQEEPNQIKINQPAKSSSARFLERECKHVLKADTWGLKVTSTEPVVVQGIHGRRGTPEDDARSLTTSMDSYFAATRLSRVWYYADGLVLLPPPKSSAKLYEPEFAYILNPNRLDAEVTITAYYADQTKGNFVFNVPAERIKVVELEKVVVLNKHYGARFVGTLPIVVQFERLAYEYENPIVRALFCKVALPWPLQWGDDLGEPL